MTAAPETAGGVSRAESLRRLLTDNPALVLSGVFVLLFVGTDVVNRVQTGGQAFLTLDQISTTFLYAAILGLMAAGQTLVMLTGGVDLSVATTATAAAFRDFSDQDPRVADSDLAGEISRRRDRRRPPGSSSR